MPATEVIGIVDPDGRSAMVQVGLVGVTIQVKLDPGVPGDDVLAAEATLFSNGSVYVTYGREYSGTRPYLATERISAGYLNSGTFLGVAIGAMAREDYGMCAGAGSVCGVWSVGTDTSSINPGGLGQLVVSGATRGLVDTVDKGGLTGDGITDALGICVSPPINPHPDLMGVLVAPQRSAYQNT